MRKCSKPEKTIYLIMNKPCGYVCSAASDSHKTVYELLTPDLQAIVSEVPRGCRLHTVGRLDCDTSGLLLITNDGKFSNKITAEKNVQKIYRAKLATPVSSELQTICISRSSSGLILPPEKKYGEQKALPATLFFDASDVCRITVLEGKFHEVRRIFRALGNEVSELERIAIGGLMLPQDLRAGQWRELSEEEKQSVLGG
ncbi:MAG: pseudouridine synthase [Spirochaetia bacterium]|nr:pseudouridine synthase [Spirochaetia bacterium]